jgi:nitrate/nitrite transporter NarK
VGWLAALPLLSIAAGVLAGGWLSDVLTRRFGPRLGRRLPGLVGMPLAALAILGAVETESGIRAAGFLAAAAGIAGLGVAPAWAVCLDLGGRHAGVISGGMNTFGNLGGALSPVVVGWSLESLGSWDAPLLTVCGAYVFATVCWLGIDPRTPLVLDDDGAPIASPS